MPPLVPGDPQLRAILLRAFPGSRLVNLRRLEGGVSARATFVELQLDDGSQRQVVVRRPARDDPNRARKLVAAEYAVLRRCAVLRIPAPRPVLVDPDHGALVLDYVPGAPDLRPNNLKAALQQMAATLALIHRRSRPLIAPPDAAGSSASSLLPRVGETLAPARWRPSAPADGWDFLARRRECVTRQLQHLPQRLDESLDEARLRAQLQRRWPWPQHNKDVLLHGDYWPGNLLWQDGQLVAVLDWEEAEVGDPLADLAVARLDVWWAFGERAMQQFTDYYRVHQQLDWTNLPLWDLLVALRPMSRLARWASSYADAPISRPDITEHTLRRDHRAFVAAARSRLPDRVATTAR